MEDPALAIAAVVREARSDRRLSAAQLAERSGVSRAMISKIERGQVQPTAALLWRLSAALSMTLSELIVRAETDDRRLMRAGDQPVWSDSATGYTRRALSPAAGRPLELVEVELPAGSVVEVPAETYAFLHQQIWVIDGRLDFREGSITHELRSGDCLQLASPAACAFINPSKRRCRYLVALIKR